MRAQTCTFQHAHAVRVLHSLAPALQITKNNKKSDEKHLYSTENQEDTEMPKESALTKMIPGAPSLPRERSFSSTVAGKQEVAAARKMLTAEKERGAKKWRRQE